MKETQAEAVIDLFKHQAPVYPEHSRRITEGDAKRVTLTEFNSDNTRRLNLEETKEKIASLEYIQNALANRAQN